MIDTAFQSKSISVSVSFYDDSEKEKLLKYPTSEQLEAVTANTLEIPFSEFLTYYLFHRKGRGVSLYENYEAIAKRIHTAWSDLEGFIEHNGKSLCTAAGVTDALPGVSEHIGEAIGLSVIGRVHKLTDADWSPIPQLKGPKSRRFDFQIASDGQNIVQVENKGSSVDDNTTIRDQKIINQYKDIVEKKLALNNMPEGKRDPYPASLRYGTITAVDPRKDGEIKCWLTDPDPEFIDANPKHMRLLSRMRFLRDCVRLISPRSQLATALATRCADLEQLRDPYELNKVPLRRGNNEEFEYRKFLESGEGYGFFSSKSRISAALPAGGTLLPCSDSGKLVFFGIQETLTVLAAEQDFDAITTYRSEPKTMEQQIACRVTKNQFDKLGHVIPQDLIDWKGGGYVGFRLSGLIHYSGAGLVFGFLDPPLYAAKIEIGQSEEAIEDERVDLDPLDDDYAE